MTREQAAAYLPWLPEVKHSMCRRAPWHDYSTAGTYMLTLVVKDRRPLLGALDCAAEPRIALSPLGRAIWETEIPKITEVYPMVRVWDTCIMPDHIHMIVHVRSALPDGKHLGRVVGAFKGGCTRLLWALTPASPQSSLFENKYNDRLLFDSRQLAAWKKYLADNPRRLAVKRRHPEFFTTLHEYAVQGRNCNIYGNRFLLDIPDKTAVIVHRSDSDSDYEAKSRQWLACGERGGVLVSVAVAPREKAVMRVAIERGYCIILLRENGFPALYKPSGEAFDACAQGRLLQISPAGYHFDNRTITRSQCLELNALAQSIASGGAYHEAGSCFI